MSGHHATVRLQPAWVWVCPNCRRRNTRPGVAATEAENGAIVECLGVLSASGAFAAAPVCAVMPESVVCGGCESAFRVDDSDDTAPAIGD
jgi:hypothetical protein